MQYPFLRNCFTPLVLLGLIVASSFIILFSSSAKAEDIEVTAKVNAPLPTSPAIIASPYDQQHFTDSPITVTGTCGDGAYVVLFRNSVAAGIGACTGGNFSIQTDLAPGANILQAKVYNSTDNEGPQSPAITVYYDIVPAEPAPPLETAVNLRVTSVDGTPYAAGRSYITSASPLIRGLARPGSTVTITFAPGIECKTTAGQYGRWVCTLATQLPKETFTVRVTSISPQGLSSTFPPFNITVSSSIPPSTPAPGGLRLLLHFPYAHRVYKVNELWSGDLVISGGSPPYSLSIEWGDGTTFQLENITSTPVNLSHTFTYAGNYQPLIHAADSKGNKASLQIVIIVIGPQEASKSSLPPWLIIVIAIVIAVIGIEIAVIATSWYLKRRRRFKNKL